MIDLIIPVYNNKGGLINTLHSIDYTVFNVIIVEDGSKDIMPSYAYTLLSLQENVGPGAARQWGMQCSKNPYIMFIDAGDKFTSTEAQQGILKVITDNPQLDFISFPYFHYDKLTTETDNRLHGKIYKRAFLEKYHITFSAASSYLNEDIGFNRTCRYCTEMKFINLPVIEQIKEPNSLTQKDNSVVLYRDQTRALSLVTLHTIDILRQNGIDTTAEINQIAIALYYWFIRTAADRPEYLQDAWNGAKIFYDIFKKEIHPENLSLGNPQLKQCLQYRDKIKFKINILRFAKDIWQNENLPDYYLTFS